jgi:radical SAM protein with 4Fe4S-binding SPASM domain
VRLLKGLLSGDIAKTGPFYVDVDITNRCNLRCLGCQYHSPELRDRSNYSKTPADISLNLFKRLCDELKAMKTHGMIITGMGEPFIHPQLSEIVGLAKRSGFYVTLFTNGTMITQKVVDALIDAQLDILNVSLWASSKEQYQKNYPGADPGNFTRVTNGLELIARQKSKQKSKFPVVQLNHVINRNNFQTINAIIDLTARTGCNGIKFARMWSSQGTLTASVLSKKEENQMRQFLLSSTDRIESLCLDHNISQLILRLDAGGDIWKKVPCYIAWYYSRIGPDGTVYPCCRCHLTMGNLQNNSLKEIWNGPEIRNFRRQALKREGLISMQRDCKCNYCCFVFDNLRVHKFFKWFSPFSTINSWKNS